MDKLNFPQKNAEKQNEESAVQIPKIIIERKD